MANFIFSASKPPNPAAVGGIFRKRALEKFFNHRKGRRNSSNNNNEEKEQFF